MARVYATEQDYKNWLDDQSATVSNLLLARASLSVDGALIGAWYSVNAEGIPIKADVVEALRDATCAQVYAVSRRESGEVAPGALASASIGSASYSLEGSSPSGDDVLPNGLSRTANQILRVAGLLPVSVITRG